MVWMGDWNSHVGRDSSGQPGVGRCALQTPTTPSGKEFLSWMADGVQDLAIIDSYHPLAYRGTWHLSRQIEGRSADQHWYELDTFLTT